MDKKKIKKARYIASAPIRLFMRMNAIQKATWIVVIITLIITCVKH